MENFLIYMDNCCFNRPFDDLSDDKVRLESESVLTIVERSDKKIWELCSSDILFDEISRMDDPVRREKVLILYASANVNIKMSDDIINRAKKLMQVNIKPFDALHIASAESINADVFLTTDKRLINASKRTNLSVRVLNPAIWIMEVLYND